MSEPRGGWDSQMCMTLVMPLLVQVYLVDCRLGTGLGCILGKGTLLGRSLAAAAFDPSLT